MLSFPLPFPIEPFKPYILMALVVMVFPLVAGYMVLLERKLMADMQARLGPMRVGPHGLLQPIADAVKLLLKEDIIPSMVDKWVFWLAPILSVTTALVAFSVIPFDENIYIADLNIGVLFLLAVTSVGVLGIILGGWASNSHYPLLGALRATAQMVSYEVVMGFAIISVLLMAGTLSMVEIVKAQAEGPRWFLFGTNNWLLPFSLIAFFLYFVAGMAETNRAPFDLPEAESELVAGYMTEYSGFRWSLFFLAEYANIFIVASIAVTLFLGGWLSPFPGAPWLDYAVPIGLLLLLAALCLYLAAPRGAQNLIRGVLVRVAGRSPEQVSYPRQKREADRLIMAGLGFAFLAVAALFAWPAFNELARGLFWFLAKVTAVVYSFMWFRFTFPRFRYDQLMRLGWQLMIPLGILNVIAVAIVLALTSQT